MYILPQLSVKCLDYDQIGHKRLAIETSNHCKGECWWCVVPRSNSPSHPIDDLMEKLDRFSGSFDSIHFMDNDLGGSPNRFFALCEQLANSPLKSMPKLGKMRVDSVSPKLIDAAVEAGFKIISLGVESFNQGILDFLSKGIFSIQIRGVLDTLLLNRIKPGINLIMFSPPETIGSLSQTLDMALKYAQLGAYLNIAERLYVSLITPRQVLERFQHITHFETIYFPGMLCPLDLPEFLIVEDADTRHVQELALARRKELEIGLLTNLDETSLSIPIRSLLLCGAISEVLGEKDLTRLTSEIVTTTLEKEKRGQIL